MKTFLILFLFLASTAFAQVERSGVNQVYNAYPGFEIDIASYKSDVEGKTRVDLFVKIPYRNLQFVKSSDGYNAKYSVHVKFSEKNTDKIIVESLWSEKIKASEFKMTESGKNFNYSLKSFKLNPGKYALRCEVVDKDSRKNYIVEATANVLDLSDSLKISDLLLISSIIKNENGESIIPNVNRKITTDDSSLPFYYEIYSDKKRDIKIEYNIKNKNEENIFIELVDKEINPGINKIIYEIENTKFSLGHHNLELKLKNFELETVSAVSKKFFSKIAGFPDNILDLDLAINQMQYIATQNEIEFISNAEEEDEKIKRYRDFWKTKDPSPHTELNEVFIEYYRRIDYANQKFSNYFKGWKSDMGMVYITLGPPSAVERHPFDMGSRPYEVWEYYHINRSFVFVDNTGFGDYRLSSSPYGEWFRYRQ